MLAAVQSKPKDNPSAPAHFLNRELSWLEFNHRVLEEALEAAGQGELIRSTPRRYLLDFASSAERDETLVGRTWPHEGGWAYRLAREDGTDIFRARLERLG